MKKIQVLGFQFKALAICGVWRPDDWISKPQLILYSVYSLICCFLIFSLTILQLLLLVLTEIDFKILTETLFTMLTSFTVCVKMTTFLFRREEITGLMDMLSRSWCVPRNRKEEDILKRSNDFIKLYTIVLNVMAQATVASMLMLALVRSDKHNVLPIQIWLPHIIWNSHKSNVWLTYAYEAMAMTISVLLNSTVDTTISGLMWQACTQLELARHRLEHLPRRLRQLVVEGKKTSRAMLMRIEKESIVQTVLHHNYIIEYATRVNEVIDFVVVEQFFASFLIIAIIVFQLSVNRHVGLLMYVINILYLGCMLLEFFSFCWFGNEITLKCAEFGMDVYRIDWCSLSSQANRMLLYIVLRTRKPFVLSVGYFIVLSVESFKSVLKVSFSAYNVLKEST